MKKIFWVPGIIVVLFFVLWQAGCNFNPFSTAGVDETTITGEPTTTAAFAKVQFKVVIPQDSQGRLSRPDGSPKPNLSILAQTGGTALVTFRLILVNVGNTTNPTTVLSKTVSVTASGSAETSFSGIPAQTTIGEIQIENGNIAGKTDFHGAADLTSGNNILEVSPVGSKHRSDVIANVLLNIVNTPDLFSKVPKNLASSIETTGASILVAATANAYTDLFEQFVVSQVSASSFVKVAKNVDSTSISGSGSSTWAKTAADLWANTPFSSSNFTVDKILRQGFGGFVYVSWVNSDNSKYAIAKIDATNGNRLSYVVNDGHCGQIMLLPDNSLLAGGTLNGRPIIFRWNGSSDATITSANYSSFTTSWAHLFTDLYKNAAVPAPEVEYLEYGLGSAKIVCVVRDPDTKLTKLYRLDPTTGQTTFTVVTTFISAWGKGGNGENLIGWDAIPGVDSYYLYWHTSNQVGTSTYSEKLSVRTNSYRHAGRSNDTPYFYRVTWVDSQGRESAPSPVVMAVPTAQKALDSRFATFDKDKLVTNEQDQSIIVQDEILVTFKDTPTAQEVATVAFRMNGVVIASFPELKTYQVRVNSNDANALLSIVNSLEAQSYENNFNFNYDAHHIIEAIGTPNDPDYFKSWGLAKIKAVESWDGLPTTNVAVAVIDTGIRMNHEDLRDCIDRENSRNITENHNGDPMNYEDGNGHGTHVSGIIAAKINNSLGIVGVAPNLKIVTIKCLKNDGWGSEINIALGIKHAANLPNVRVINMSLGRRGLISRVMAEAVDYAVSKGKLVVVAAGNNADNASYFSPAHYESCFAVGASDGADARARFSNHGPAVDIAAPGLGIYSSYNSDDSSYVLMSGTSMAAPFVSGLAGALFSIKPELTADQVRTVIQTSADAITPDKAIGAGRINMAKAIAAIGGGAKVNHPPTSVTITGSTTLDAGATGDYKAVAVDSDDISGWTFTWTNSASDLTVKSTSGLESTASWKAPDTGGKYYISCKVTDSNGGSKEGILEVYVKPKPIAIAYLSPTSGKSGTEVLIAGSNFGATQGNNGVKVNGVAVTEFVSWSDTQIKIKIPLGAASGLVVVTINGVDSNGAQFDIDNAVPVFSAVASGSVTETSVTITWITDENSTSQVEYGTTTNYGTTTTLDTTMTKSHSVSLSGFNSNTAYHFRVRSKDVTGNEAVSGDYTFVTLNVGPTVSITSPVNNSAFTVGDNVTISATATDTDGTVAKVEFYQGSNLLGEDTSAPYSYAWNNVQAWNYTLTAKATDNNGATKTSTAVSVVVNVPSTVSITSPSNNTLVAVGDTITITATATASVGSVTKVEFYDGNTLLGQSTTSPYSFSWSNATSGNHALTAKAYDSSGDKTSLSVNVIVNALPSVSITSPGNNAVFTTGGNVTISATAADSDGTVSKVEFYQGSNLLGEDTSAPYSFTWNNVQASNYTLTAKATDNNGGSKTTGAISIIVNTLPTVSITSPANNATFTAGDNITITANAADTDGTVAKVEFYQGATFLGQSTSSPYSYVWTNVQSGNYSLTAKVYDNAGGIKVSDAVNFTAKTLPPTASLAAENNGFLLKLNLGSADGKTITDLQIRDGNIMPPDFSGDDFGNHWDLNPATHWVTIPSVKLGGSAISFPFVVQSPSADLVVDLSGTTSAVCPNIRLWVVFSAESSIDTSTTWSPPVISNVVVSNITTSTAVITWTTDENSTSVVEFGPTTAYGSVASVPGSVTAHTVPLSGLASGTTYHFRVKSVDAVGNESNSSDSTFNTLIGSISWSSATSRPTPSLNGMSVVVGGKIYTFGGSGGQSTEVYDPGNDTWATKTPMPRGDGRFCSGIGAAGNGKIYIFGGANTGGNYLTTTIDEYDPVNDVWVTDRGSMPEAVYGVSCANYNGYLYVFGGYPYNDANLGSLKAYKYDHTTQVMNPIADLPEKVTSGRAETVGNKIYLLFYGALGQGIRSVIEYDPVANSYQYKAPMPVLGDSGISAAFNGKIYVPLFHNASVWYKDIYEYNPQANTWRSVPWTGSRVDRYGAYGGIVGNKYFVIGGATAGVPIGTNEFGILGN